MSQSKRPSLAENLKRVARPEAAPASLNVPSETTAQTVATDPATGAAAQITASPAVRIGFYAATRAGKKKLTTAVTEEAHKQFRILATERGQKGEALLIEAINDLFSKYGKPPIA